MWYVNVLSDRLKTMKALDQEWRLITNALGDKWQCKPALPTACPTQFNFPIFFYPQL